MSASVWASCGQARLNVLEDCTMENPLTQKFVNSVTSNGAKQRFPDNKVRGLVLRIAPGGTKVWVIRYRSLDGTSREMKIAEADKMPIDDARKKARVELANVPTGDDPLKKHRQAKREAVIGKERTVSAITAHYRRSTSYITKRDSTRLTYDNSLDKHILPRIGERSITSLKRGDISGLLDEVHSECSGNVANQARSALSVVLSFAVERDIIDFNPMRGVKAKHKTPVRKRILTDEELKALWAALEAREGLSETVADMVQLLMLLPARSQEVAGMAWSELNLIEGIWSLTPARMKGGEAHELPLGETAIDLLKRRKEDATTPWVFPNKSGTEPMNRQRPSRACNRLSKSFGWESFGPHDLRRTIATRMAGMGLGHATIERTLGHKVGAGKAIVNYDHYDYRDRKRNALESWEAELVRVLSSGEASSNIYHLRETA